MTKYCPECGRLMPEDGIRCPYCGKLVAKHEGIKVEPPKELKKEKNIGFIIAVVLIVLIIIPVAIAATVYVYVSGMIDSNPSMQVTPTIAAMINSDSGNNATLFITYIGDDSIYWSDISFEIYDVTDGETLTEYTDYTTDAGYGLVKNSENIRFTGLDDEFEDGNEYRLTVIYNPTNNIMYSKTWTQ